MSITPPLYVRLRVDKNSFDMEKVRFKSKSDDKTYYIRCEMVDYYNTYMDFSIYDESMNEVASKRYTMDTLKTLFTEDNRKAIYDKIYNSQKHYREPAYARGASLEYAMAFPPEGVTLVREDTNKTFRTPEGSYYINLMGLAAITDDMGYLSRGGFRAEYMYLIE